MRFKYQLHEGEVSFSVWIALCMQVARLIIIRGLRFAKRVQMYMKRYIAVFFCIVIFETIIIPIGMHLGKYTSWIDGIWDLRSFFFTSILISVVGGVLQEELKRHKILTEQFWIYKLFAFESNQFLERLCFALGMQYGADKFLNEKLEEDFLSFVYSRIEERSTQYTHSIEELPTVKEPHFMYTTPELKPKTYIVMAFKRYLKVIDSLVGTIQRSSFIGTIDYAIDQLDDIQEEIQNELVLIELNSDNYSEMQLLKFVEGIFRGIYPVMGHLRRPWRWDMEINEVIAQLLEK